MPSLTEAILAVATRAPSQPAQSSSLADRIRGAVRGAEAGAAAFTPLTITEQEAEMLRELRAVTSPRLQDLRKSLKKEVFDAIKVRLGIDADTKLKVEIDNTTSPSYRVVIDKATNRPVGQPGAQQSTPVSHRGWYHVRDSGENLLEMIAAASQSLVRVESSDVDATRVASFGEDSVAVSDTGEVYVFIDPTANDGLCGDSAWGGVYASEEYYDYGRIL